MKKLWLLLACALLLSTTSLASAACSPEEAQKKAFLLTDELHHCGVPADCDLCGRGLKAQMKYADKIGAQYSIVLGDDEIANGEAVLKNMKTGEKKKISLNDDFVDTYITAVTEQEDAMPITF